MHEIHEKKVRSEASTRLWKQKNKLASVGKWSELAKLNPKPDWKKVRRMQK